MSNFLILVVDILYWALFILIFARVILSWVRTGFYEIRHLVYRITDPIIEPVRRLLPATSGLDFSPFIILILAYVVREILRNIIGSL